MLERSSLMFEWICQLICNMKQNIYIINLVDYLNGDAVDMYLLNIGFICSVCQMSNYRFYSCACLNLNKS